jgi:AraC-like DNA-binding protein
MDEPLVIESVHQVHGLATSLAPTHPLITVIGASWQPPVRVTVPLINRRITSHLYSLSLKKGNECGIRYGRTSYDFQEGSLLSIAPGQSITPITEASDITNEPEGWTLMFHPDLLRRSGLAKRMNEYTFFNYDSSEALHLSDPEQRILTDLVRGIEREYKHIDEFSDELLVSHLQLFLDYCKRFYQRQFVTRTSSTADIVSRVEKFLRDYFDSVRPTEEGLPSVSACAKNLGYSADYLSDLLRKETGKSAREHIHFFLIERAKDYLLGSEKTVSEVAFLLGFEHPQHFSKLFKSKTGVSPGAYRN